MNLQLNKSKQVLKKMSDKLSMKSVGLAEGILSIINTKMSDAIRTITVKQGIDPREFSLVAYGGAAPMHAVWIAEELEIKEIIVPPSPGTFSAWGMLQTDIRKDLNINFYFPLAVVKKESLKKRFKELTNEASILLKSEGVTKNKMVFNFSVDMRYIGQEYYVNIPVNPLLDLKKIEKDFHKTYNDKYGHSQLNAPVEITNLRLAAFGLIDRPIDYSKNLDIKKNNQINKKINRKVIFGNKKYSTNVINRNSIKIEDVLSGPIIIEEKSATTVIPPKYLVTRDLMGNLIIKKKSK